MHVARANGLPVIEDTCHVWGSTNRAGLWGHRRCSFLFITILASPFINGMGGAATVNTSRLRRKMRNLYGSFRKPSTVETAKLNMQYLAHRLTRNPRLFWVVRDAYRFLSRRGVAIATWTSDSLQENSGPIMKSDSAPGLKTRLGCNGSPWKRRYLAAQNTGSANTSAACKLIGIPVLARDSESEPVLICYPFQVANKSCLLQEARRARVELGDWIHRRSIL